MTGVIPNQQIAQMIEAGEITAVPAVTDAQIQPASLDLRLGNSGLPRTRVFLVWAGAQSADRLEEFEMHRVDLTTAPFWKKGASMSCL